MSNKKSYVIYNTITEQYLARKLKEDVFWVDEILSNNWILQFSEDFTLTKNQNVLVQTLFELGITGMDNNLEFIQVDDTGVNFLNEKIRLADILTEK